MRKLFIIAIALCLLAAPLAASAFNLADYDLDSMMPLFDSMSRAFESESASPATNDNPNFIWLSLFYYGTNFSGSNPDAEFTGDYLYASLPSDTVLGVAQAMFYGLRYLPEIPQYLTEWDDILYEPAADRLFFMQSDMGESYTEIDMITRDELGRLMVTVGMYWYDYEADEAVFMDDLTFVLDDNPSDTSPYYQAIVSVGRG